jgi:hypothetical protein
MANNGIPGVYAPIKYLWAQIQAEGILNDSHGNPIFDYKGLVPIIPIQDEPALLQAIGESDGVSSAPYIVYTWYSNGIDSDWFITYDTIVFTVKSQDLTIARKLILLMKTLFRRYDESATAVNDFVSKTNFGAYDADYKAYGYTYISVWALTGGLPGTVDLEPVHATVTIRVGFTWDGNDQPLPPLP